MKKPWEVYAYDVNGNPVYPTPFATFRTRRGAERYVKRWPPIPAPLPGKPLYTLVIERSYWTPR